MRQYLKATMVAMKDICVSRYDAFGTAGWADKIKVTSLEDRVRQLGITKLRISGCALTSSRPLS